LCSISLPSRKELSITASGSSIAELDRAISEAAASEKASLLERFVFAGIQHCPELKNSANSIDGCVTWLQGDACKDGEVSAMQGFAVSGTKTMPVTFRGKTVGYSYEDDLARYCRLGNIVPTDKSASCEAQTLEVFEAISESLKGAGFKFNEIIRTWFYLSRLLNWYKEFNAVRTAFFSQEGVFEKMVPASTGIGAANASGASLACNVLAVQPKSDKIKIAAVDSPMQSSALNYKSSFSRAVELSCPTHRCLFISGSASIDKEGRTVHLGDTEKQIGLTMEVVGALLRSRGMGWADVSRSIAYFTRMDDRKFFTDYCTQNKLPKFPVAMVHTDICRADLLFELEADAIVAN